MKDSFKIIVSIKTIIIILYNNKIFNNRDSYNASLFSNCLPGYDKVLIIKQNPKDNSISIISKCVRTTDDFVNEFLKKIKQ